MSTDRTSYTEADAATTKQIATEIGWKDDRRLRQILSTYDGDVVLIAKCRDGIFLAESPDQAASLTAELTAKTRSLEGRLRRRAAFAFRHEPAQITMGLAS